MLTTKELKGMVGTQLFWDDISNRYIIERSGCLTDVYRMNLCFDDNQDYRHISDFKNLRSTSMGES